MKIVATTQLVLQTMGVVVVVVVVVAVVVYIL
jgi:hypothetical protein